MAIVFEHCGPEDLPRRAAAHLCRQLLGVLRHKPRAVLAVPGGRSVARIFEALRGEAVDWGRVDVFVLDERLVPLHDPDSNFRLLREHLLEPLRQEGHTGPAAHPFIADPALPDSGALAYERELEACGSGFDVLLLSAGEDGHVGSLFPDHHCLADPRHGFVVMDDAPKPPPRRMSASLALLLAARAAVLLFAGPAKAGAYARFKDPATPITSCPARLVLELPEAVVISDLD